MVHNLSRPWRLSLLYTLLHAISIQCIPSQRWNIEAGLPSEQDPRALSPMGDGLASMHQRRGLDAAVVIDEWTAMGDSYASGVGAGENIPPMLPCRRYDHSYPVLMDSDNRLGASNGHTFNPVMCSGSTFKNIQSGGPHSQVDQLGNPTVATLSIGGNNVGFRAILTACIYRFYAYRSGDCDTEIANSQAIIDSDDFSTGLTKSINDALKKATKPDFHLFVTGYAAFFNQDTTQCNKVNVALWIGSSAYWTQDMRKSMNTLLGNLNAKISQVTNAIGSPKVTYVDVDHLFNTHRFCEEPIKEPAFRDENIWFFHWYTDERDLSVSSPWTGIDASTCNPNADDWGDAFHCQIAITHAANDTLTLSQNAYSSTSGSGSISPELARVFHPKAGGQQAYANAIFEAGIQTSYTPGWCTMHVIQFQKADPSKDNYRWDVTIFDGADPPVKIGYVASVQAPVGTGIPIKSRLPYPLVLTPGNVDRDAVLFSYNGQNWGSNDQQHYSNFGKYYHGKREGDTGFSC